MEEASNTIVRLPSGCTLETAQATQSFKITGYSLLKKGIGRGKCIISPVFSTAGHQWRILYFPNGDNKEKSEGYVSLFLELLNKHDEVSARCTFKLMHQVTGQSVVVTTSKAGTVFAGAKRIRGFNRFMKISAEEESAYVWNDHLVIECVIEVSKETMIGDAILRVHVPPSDMLDNLAKLLEEKRGADMTFTVQGEAFPAHKVVLAMRSPVFDAMFYGPMGDKGRQDITIEDMQPIVFKALLHFIYTDSMPPMKDLDDGEKREMVKHLLVAADRYGMKRMKMMCESILCKSLDVETVTTMLALADQHHCNNLEGACIEFINASNRMEDVMASQDYAHLKRSCPAVLVDMMEKVIKRRKN